MRKSILFSIAIFVPLILFLYIFHLQQLSQRVNSLKKAYQNRILELARSISIGYFHRDRVYSFVVQDRFEELKAGLDQVKVYYPQIEKIDVLDYDELDFHMFKILPAGTKIQVITRILNGDASLYVPNKVASFVLNAQVVLDELDPSGLLKIGDVGRDFVYGLKYRFAKPILLYVIYIALLFTGLSALFLGLYVQTKHNLRSRTQILQKESTLRKMSEAIVEITNVFIQNELSDDIYQRILEKAVEIIRNAQGGSVIVKKDDHYVYVAAVGYDLKELSKIKFSPEHIASWVNERYSIKRKNDIIALNKNDFSPEEFEILRRAGRLEEIMCSLNLAVELNGEIVLQLNLDNFETEVAFNEETKKLAQSFANQLGIFLYKKRLSEEIAEQQRRLEYMSYHDQLTGLLNRTALREFGENLFSLAMREQKQLALIFLDLSKFKQVNDKHGHITGDKVLKIIGERLKESVRQSDLLARFGGDEFIILAYDICLEDMNSLINRIFHAVEKPIKIGDKTFELSVQIGVAIFPQDGETLDELIRKADFAMYRAKEKQISVVFYGDEKIDSV